MKLSINWCSNSRNEIKNKHFIFAFIFTCFIVGAAAQNSKQIFIGTGIGTSTHQNQVFSLNEISGISGRVQIGYSSVGKNYFSSSIEMNVHSLDLNHMNVAKSMLFEPTLNIAWMKGIGSTSKYRFFIGGELEGSGLLRTTTNLGNNGRSMLFNNTLLVAIRMERPLGESKWKLGGELSVGLLSWVKSSDSYAFSAPQNFLTEGKFNYDEDVTLAPYKYGAFATIGKFNRLKTNISLSREGKKTRWGVAYNWQLKAYEPYEHGQIVEGNHAFQVFFGYKLGRKKGN